MFLVHMALAAAFAGPAASAASIADYARLPECRLNAAGTALAVQPCRTAKPRQPMARRAVPLNVTPTPRMAPAPDPSLSWAPVLTPPSRLAQSPGYPRPAPAPGSPAARDPGPSGPIPVTCDAGGCRDASGTFYHGPPGQVLSPSGKTCSHNGVWMTCF